MTCNRCLVEIVKKLSSGIKSVRALIDESDGVSGLHLNGDAATWEELQQRGQFEGWLTDFNIAENIEDAKC